MEKFETKEYLIRIQKHKKLRTGAKEIITWNWEIKISKGKDKSYGMAIERKHGKEVKWARLKKTILLDEMIKKCEVQMDI
jgi:hypothetical protein